MKTNRKLFALLGLTVVPVLNAQVVDYSLQELGACVPDMQAFCADVPGGGGRRVRCVRENAVRISPACKAAVVEPNDFSDGQKGVSIAVSVVPAHPDSINVTFRNLKPGLYAVFAYHDANDNSRLDTNFMGLPTEGVGYSNKATGIPNFKASALRVSADSKLSVSLVYHAAY
jgi:hypothetical protein